MAEVYPPAVNVLSEEKKQQVLALGRLAHASNVPVATLRETFLMGLPVATSNLSC